jgi:hypothetical protein
MAPEEARHSAFDELAAKLSSDPKVAHGTGFGPNGGLRVDGKIFAIFSGEALTVKLPAHRVEELVAAGGALPFDAGKGRPMREWVTLAPGRASEWADLAEEALRFVARR